jgi:sugar transferase (PEP-CTERM/EpsH1 system associated)
MQGNFTRANPAILIFCPGGDYCRNTSGESGSHSVKILFLAHRVPYPPDKGEKIRAYHELRFLAARHEVDLFAFADKQEREAALPALSKLCRRVHLEDLPRHMATLRAMTSLLTSKPFTNAYFFSNRLATAIRTAISNNRYDAAFVYCSAMASYVVESSPVPVIVDFVDSDASKWAQYAQRSGFPLSWLYRREAALLGQYERKIAQTARLCLAATSLETEAIDPENKLSLRVLENGVSVSKAFSAEIPDEIAGLGRYVVFVGQMDYRPNVDAVCYFADEILPDVRKAHPELKFLVVGRNPTRRVRRLAGRPGVVVTGTVPDVHPYLCGAVAAVAPFRICQGVQNKILEALAIGLPVLCTPRPARAIGGGACESLFIASSSSEFSRMLIKIIDDPKGAREVSGKAVDFVSQRFNWDRNLAHLEVWLQEAVNEGKVPASREG